MVSVKKSGKHVTNSPFKIMVGQSEIGDASKVKVSGKGLVEGRTFEMSEFIVDTRTAGEEKEVVTNIVRLQNTFHQPTQLGSNDGAFRAKRN